MSHAPPTADPGGQPLSTYVPRPSTSEKPRRGRRIVMAIVIVLAVMAIAIAGTVWLLVSSGRVTLIRSCPYVTDGQASELLGVNAEAKRADEGGFDSLGESQILPGKEACHIYPITGQSPFVDASGRTVNYTGDDAAELFEAELAKAKEGGTPLDLGGGVMESGAYYSHDVPDLGDRAFCTRVTPELFAPAGVMALEGDTLVYVASTRLSERSGNGGRAPSTVDETGCEADQALAKEILAGGS